MNSILLNPVETAMDIRSITTETAPPEDLYSTTPLNSIHSLYRQSNEDELHSSFEEAISDRVVALNKQLRHLSVPLSDIVSEQSPIIVEAKQQSPLIRISLLRPGSRKAMLLIAVALMLIMVGFDLMGLFVLLTP